MAVKVNTFPIDPQIASKLKPKIEKIEKQLEQQRWKKIVKVKGKDEHVNIYVKFDNQERMAGLVIMALENNDEAVFVNVVGELDWKEISKLGKKFDIDELKDINEQDKPNK